MELGMTQGDMAFMCGVPRITYETWERRSVGNTVSRFLNLLTIPENRDLMMRMALEEARVKSEAE